MIQALTPIIRDDELYEFINGQRVLKPMSTYENVLAGELHGYLRDYLLTNRHGRATIEVLFDLPGLPNDRRPDVAFVSYARWPESRGIPQSNAWPAVPDLAIEVISPNDGFRDVLEAVSEYFQAGARMVWLVVPGEDVVYVYTSRTDVRILARGDELNADPVIPGFRLPMNDLFPPAYQPDEPTNGAS